MANYEETLLIVDDNQDNLSVLANILENHGYRVCQARSGPASLEAIQEELPDLILLDIMMPEMDGYEVCRRLKADSRARDIPVIFLTALNSLENKRQAFESGGVDYISKPFQEEEILLRVATHISLYRLRAALQQKNQHYQEALEQKLKAENRIHHLNAVLRSLRDVNQLIGQESRKEDLIHKACQMLVDHPGYSQVWIALLENDGGIHFLSHAGFQQENTRALHAWLTENRPLTCAHSVLLGENEALFEHPEQQCSGCPLASAHQQSACLVGPMIFHKRFYGLLAVSMPREFAADSEEQELFRELRNDLGVALYRLENEQARHEMENALKRERDRAQLYLDLAGVMFLALDTQGTILMTNRKTCEILDCRENSIVGLNWFEHFLPEEVREEVRRVFQQLMNNEVEPVEYVENLVCCRGGREKVIAWHNTVLRDDIGNIIGTLSSGEDITERKRSEQALRDSEQQYRQLVETLQEGVWVIDKQAKTSFVNPRMAEMLGYEVEDMRGRSVFDFMGAEARQQCEHYLQRRYQGIAEQHDFEFRRRDGSLLYASLETSPFFDKEGNYAGTLAAVADISARRQAEEALRRNERELENKVAHRTRELKQLNVRLQQLAKLKDEFLASMSHELRSPLNVILTGVEMLQEGIYDPLNARQAETVARIGESGSHLLGLINDILDVSKIEAGKLELDLKPVDPLEICQVCLNLIQDAARKKQLHLENNCRAEAVKFQADPRRLKQILLNLLSNAVKFTPAGGHIGLEFRNDPENRQVQFTVWDTGIGIAENLMDRLFQPFVQLDSRLSRGYEGTGLGLVLVKSLADLHGGSVNLQSEVNRGSRFTVRLPWQLDDKYVSEAADSAESGQTASDPGAAGNHILVVEDNTPNRLMLMDYLQARGYRVSSAAGGAEGVKKARDEPPDLIIMDIQMPDMDGLEATHYLRADHNPRVAGVPILALTALAMPGDRERCLSAGVDEYLSKPVVMRTLVESVQRLLRKTGID